MQYGQIVSGKFILRNNRFVAQVAVNGQTELCHVKNTGRCRELLIPGAEVFLALSDDPVRKTRYDLVAVRKERPGQEPLLINMDSQIPNGVVGEYLPRSGLFSAETVFKREVHYNNSRFDFFAEDGKRKVFIEVKGVTLEKEGAALFPDAPTERGVKHLNELVQAVGEGFECYVFFVIQMKEIHCFRPNDDMHPAFGKALRAAAASGVKLLAMDCIVTPDSLVIDAPVRIDL